MDLAKVSKAYKSTEDQSIQEVQDPHAIVTTMLGELTKAMDLFISNIDVKTGNTEIKSKNFARALTIIYALQSSLDFEKGGEIAAGLFQLYEYARQQLLSDMQLGKAETSGSALTAIQEILEAWTEIEPVA